MASLRRVFSGDGGDRDGGDRDGGGNSDDDGNSGRSSLSGSVPMSRTKSTPHPGGGSGTGGSRKLAYAMRKVFSREEESEWRRQEAEELVRSDHSLQHPSSSISRARTVSRVTSRVVLPGRSEGAGMMSDDEDEDGEGAELVLDEVEFDDVDLNDDGEQSSINASVARTMLSERRQRAKQAKREKRERRAGRKSDDKSGGYKLRRFLSTPNPNEFPREGSTLSTASSMRRTPSYEPQGYDEYGDPDESPLHDNDRTVPSSGLSNSVALKRTISFRKKRSISNQSTSGKMLDDYDGDEDLSTIASSISSSAYQHGKRKRGRRAYAEKRNIWVTVVFLMLAGASVAVYMTVGRSSSSGSEVSEANSLEWIPLGESNDVQLVLDEESADDPSESESESESEDVQVSIDHESSSESEAELAAESGDDEEASWASQDGASDAEVVINGETGEPDPPSEMDETGAEEQEDVAPEQGEEVVKEEDGDRPQSTATTSTTTSTTVSPPNGVQAGLSSDSVTLTLTSATPPPTEEPTPPPTPSPTKDTYTFFYLMADCPYDDNERENLMPGYIEDLSTEAEFLVHLGDLSYAREDHCSEYANEAASNILKKSPVPTFVLPGDNDINDCDTHEWGEEMWERYFRKMDERWDHNFDVTRWGDLDESFSFLHKGVIYFGLNIVGGDPYSNSEKRRRHKEHLRKIREVLDGLDDDDYQVMVLLGHADPSEHHDDFFYGDDDDGFASIAKGTGKPTVHFHGDYHEWYEVEGDFDNDDYVRISLDGESWAPPIKVEIDVGRKNPVRISRRREGLEVDCCRYGWPGHDEL